MKKTSSDEILRLICLECLSRIELGKSNMRILLIEEKKKSIFTLVSIYLFIDFSPAQNNNNR